MDDTIVTIKRLCDAYIKNAEEGKKASSSAGWWSGYFTGQKKMAEIILNAINEK